jgi:hypothetical protein
MNVSPVILLVLLSALLALVIWTLVKAFRNFRNGGDPNWKAYDQDTDGTSRSDKATSFLKYPWSQ